MSDRFIVATLPCDCEVEVSTPDGQAIGVQLVTCAGQCANPTDAPFLVTWHQGVAVTVAELVVPQIVVDGQLVDAQLDRTTPASDGGAADDDAGDARDLDGVDPPDEPSYFTPGKPLSYGDQSASPKTDGEWRAIAHQRGLPHSVLIQRARAVADRWKATKPNKLGDIDARLTPLVMEWLDEHHPRPPAETS